MAIVPNVPKELWANLYKASDDFFALAPWRFMAGGGIFGVVNPENQERGHCCVMGQLGQVFGIATYLGSDGLAAMEELFVEDGPANPADAVLRKRCLLVEYVGSSELEKEDKAIIKSLGLKYRGQNAWPLFRSIRPGGAPWFLEDWEVRFLTTILQQAIHVCVRILNKPDLIAQDSAKMFFRVPETKDGHAEWVDKWLEPIPHKKIEIPKLTFDEIGFAAAKKKVKRIDSAWEIELTLVPMPVMDRDRPYFLRFFMVADQTTGFLYTAEPMDPFHCNDLLLPKIIDIIAKSGAMPNTMLFRNPELRSLLHESLGKMGIQAKYVRELPVIEEAYEGMMQFLGGG